MLLHAILELHKQVQATPLGLDRVKAAPRREAAALAAHADARSEGPAGMGDITQAPDGVTPAGEIAPSRESPRATSSPSARVCSVATEPVTPPVSAVWFARSALDTASERPYGGWFDEVVDILAEVLTEQGIDASDTIRKVVIDRGEITIEIAREHIVAVCQAMRDEQDLRFEYQPRRFGVHYPTDIGHPVRAVYHCAPSRTPHGGVAYPTTTTGVLDHERLPDARLARSRDLQNC